MAVGCKVSRGAITRLVVSGAGQVAVVVYGRCAADPGVPVAPALWYTGPIRTALGGSIAGNVGVVAVRSAVVVAISVEVFAHKTSRVTRLVL